MVVEATWMFTDLYPVLDRKASGVSLIMFDNDRLRILTKVPIFLLLSLTQMGMELSLHSPQSGLDLRRLASKVSEHQDH